MAQDFNRISIVGNLTKDPDLRSLPNTGKMVCNITVANNDHQDNTIFYRCTIWGKMGENAAQYLTKGKKVLVSGRHSIETYETDDGETRYQECIKNVSDIQFLTPKGKTEESEDDGDW